MKLDFKYLEEKLLKYNAKSELKQASIVMIRSIFNEAESKQLILPKVSKSVNCEHVRGSVIITDDLVEVECRKCGKRY